MPVAAQCLGAITAYLREPAPFSVPDDFEDEGLSGREVWAVAADLGRYMLPLETIEFRSEGIEARPGANGRQGARIRGRLGELATATIDLAIVPGQGILELDVRLDKRRTRVKEAIHVAFPFALDSPLLEIEGPGYVYVPGIQGPGSCFDWYTVHNWLAVSGATAQIVLAPLDAPLICVDEPRHDRWGQELPPFTGAITSFIANNSWWTNYPQEQGGTICSRYRLSTLPASASRADRFRAGWEAAVPLVAYPVRAAEAYGLLADGDVVLAGAVEPCAMVVGLQADGTCPSGVPTLRVRVQEIAGTGGACHDRDPAGARQRDRRGARRRRRQARRPAADRRWRRGRRPGFRRDRAGRARRGAATSLATSDEGRGYRSSKVSPTCQPAGVAT